jgi:hypothetical protein
MTLPGAAFCGLSNIFYDFFDHPEKIKELFSFIFRGYMRKLDFLEENNLLSLNNDGTYVGSGGYGYTRELPQKDFDGTHVRCIDSWGFAVSRYIHGGMLLKTTVISDGFPAQHGWILRRWPNIYRTSTYFQ